MFFGQGFFRLLYYYCWLLKYHYNCRMEIFTHPRFNYSQLQGQISVEISRELNFANYVFGLSYKKFTSFYFFHSVPITNLPSLHILEYSFFMSQNYLMGYSRDDSFPSFSLKYQYILFQFLHALTTSLGDLFSFKFRQDDKFLE
jgi:hypothetical protein